MKFIADSMLGRLARWLRLLGFDTLYYPQIEDDELVSIAKEGNRVLLTRDTRLVKRRAVKNFLLLEENDPFGQLKRVLVSYGRSTRITGSGLSGFHIYSRCSLCNALLDDIDKDQAKAHVPKYVYLTSESFSHCQVCGKYYWKGTHRELLDRKLSDVLKEET